jgi:hypothetical protein
MNLWSGQIPGRVYWSFKINLYSNPYPSRSYGRKCILDNVLMLESLMPVQNGNLSTNQYSKHSGRLPASLMHAANIPKPQDRFMVPVNNENHNIWRPILKTKFNALVPLDYVPIPDEDAMDSSDLEDIIVLYGCVLYHPYFPIIEFRCKLIVT